MLYVLPCTEAINDSVSIIVRYQYPIYTMNTESKSGKSLLNIKRNYNVLEIDAKILYHSSGQVRAKLIDIHNIEYHVTADSVLDLLKQLNYQSRSNIFSKIKSLYRNQILKYTISKIQKESI